MPKYKKKSKSAPKRYMTKRSYGYKRRAGQPGMALSTSINAYRLNGY